MYNAKGCFRELVQLAPWRALPVKASSYAQDILAFTGGACLRDYGTYKNLNGVNYMYSERGYYLKGFHTNLLSQYKLINLTTLKIF